VESVAVEFVVFSLIGTVGLGLNEAIIWFVREKIHLHYMVEKTVSAGVVLVWNFGARRSMLLVEGTRTCSPHYEHACNCTRRPRSRR
jgi:hypothetical protein